MNIRPLNIDKAYSINSKENLDKKYSEENIKISSESAGKARIDSLEISAEAQKLQPIQTKINEGFYNKPEIIREVASRIAKQFPAPSES
jgi:hypothetical protein